MAGDDNKKIESNAALAKVIAGAQEEIVAKLRTDPKLVEQFTREQMVAEMIGRAQSKLIRRLQTPDVADDEKKKLLETLFALNDSVRKPYEDYLKTKSGGSEYNGPFSASVKALGSAYDDAARKVLKPESPDADHLDADTPTPKMPRKAEPERQPLETIRPPKGMFETWPGNQSPARKGQRPAPAEGEWEPHDGRTPDMDALRRQLGPDFREGDDLLFKRDITIPDNRFPAGVKPTPLNTLEVTPDKKGRPMYKDGDRGFKLRRIIPENPPERKAGEGPVAQDQPMPSQVQPAGGEDDQYMPEIPPRLLPLNLDAKPLQPDTRIPKIRFNGDVTPIPPALKLRPKSPVMLEGIEDVPAVEFEGTIEPIIPRKGPVAGMQGDAPPNPALQASGVEGDPSSGLNGPRMPRKPRGK